MVTAAAAAIGRTNLISLTKATSWRRSIAGGRAACSEDNSQVVGNTLEGHLIRGLDGPPEKMLFRQIFLDTAQLARIVMGQPEVDPARVGAMGGSQGGALTLVCAALEPRIRRTASIFPFLSDYQRVWEMDLAKDAYRT